MKVGIAFRSYLLFITVKLTVMMYNFFIVLLTVAYASAFHKVPLYRMAGSMDWMMLESAEIESRSSVVPFINYKKMQYFGYINIGSPPQSILATFDTGSADMFVLSTACDSTDCRKHSRYDHSLSRTYVANGMLLKISYGSGSASVEGKLSSDTITVADAKITQTFLEVQSLSDNLMKAMKFDALVGIPTRASNFSSISVSDVPTMFDNMGAASLVPPIFSSYFNRDASASNGGLLTLGGMNESHFHGDLHYVSVSGYYWMFAIEYIYVGKEEISTGYSDGLADTGSSLILAPSDQATKLYKALGANMTWNLPSVGCSRVPELPALIFTISGTQFPLESSDYIFRKQTNSGTACLIGIRKSPEPHWILGNVFLGRYYSVHDVRQRRIGFAEAVHPFIG